jgi:hypothetical protein
MVRTVEDVDEDIRRAIAEHKPQIYETLVDEKELLKGNYHKFMFVHMWGGLLWPLFSWIVDSFFLHKWVVCRV